MTRGDVFEHPNGARVRVLALHGGRFGHELEVEVEHLATGRVERMKLTTLTRTWRLVGDLRAEAERQGFRWVDDVPATERSADDRTGLTDLKHVQETQLEALKRWKGLP